MYKLFILFFLVAITSCVAQNNNTGSLQPKQIELDATSCFGRCKAERIIINQNLQMEYEGIKNVTFIGNYTATISVEDYKKLLKLFKQKKFAAMEPTYLSNIADLQKFTIKLGNKEVQFQERNASKELKEIHAAINKIIDSYYWAAVTK